jgi:adenylate cyclase
MGQMHARTSGRRLSTEELAVEARVDVESVERLVAAGVLRTDADGWHPLQNILQIRLIEALAEGGVGLDDLVWVIKERGMPLDRVAEGWTVADVTGRSFAEFAASLGERAEVLPAVYAAFGLAVPAPDTLMRRDEEDAVAGFLELWGMVDDRPEASVRAARIAGEGVRRITLGTIDLFDEVGGPPPSRLRRGLPREEAMAPSQRIGPVLEQTLLWLLARHTEHEVFERVVRSVEQGLAQAGRKEQPRTEPPAIAFVDLSGYTSLAAAAGDEEAARTAALLHELALGSASAPDGRVVKLLGDGVVLRYTSSAPAVASVAALMTAVRDDDLPPAHSGIAAGPIVSRDGDVYGHTVNLASRIASHASPHELLVPLDMTERVTEAGFDWEDAGAVQLKGIPEPVHLARVRIDTGARG